MKNMNFQMALRTADEAKNCWRCKQLGIEEKTINEGDYFIAMLADDVEQGSACMDCFLRLQEELEEQP